MSRVSVEPDKFVETNQLYEAYEFEMKESGIYNNSNPRIFSQHILKVFPGAIRKLVKTRSNTITKYQGLSLKTLSPINEQVSNDLKDIKQYLPKESSIEESAKFVKCVIDSGYLSNGNKVEKTIIFNENGEWQLQISGTWVELSTIFIENKYKINKENIETIIQAVRSISLCQAVKVTKSVVVSRFHTLEKWSNINNEAERKVRSVMCKRVIPLHIP